VEREAVDILLLVAALAIFLGIPVAVWLAVPKEDRMGWKALTRVRDRMRGT
jgi:hypothetical protein